MLVWFRSVVWWSGLTESVAGGGGDTGDDDVGDCGGSSEIVDVGDGGSDALFVAVAAIAVADALMMADAEE